MRFVETCLSTNDLIRDESYKCICSKKFYSSQCQFKKASVHINLNNGSMLSARATFVQLYDFHFLIKLVIKYQQIYHDYSTTILYDHDDFHASILGFLKIYEDLVEPQYFIMYIQNQTTINISSPLQHCPHVLSLLSKGKSIVKLNKISFLSIVIFKDLYLYAPVIPW